MTVTDVLAGGLAAGYGVAIPIGGIGALLVGLSARTSLRVGASAALGVATADGVYALVAVLAGTAVARLVTPVAGPLRWVAGLVLIAVAARMVVLAALRYRAPVGRPEPGPGLGTPTRAYFGLLGMTVLNPTTVVYFVALVIGRESTGPGVGSPLYGGVFVLAVFAASASWQLLLAGGGSLLGRVVNTPRGRLITTGVAGAVIVVLAVKLLVGV